MGASPQLRLVGPPQNAAASTSTALVPRQAAPLVCYDVGGYYAALGVPWTATRRELADAYRALEGPNDARLTWVFKQLLNREFRADYDARQPGDRPLRDPATIAALRRRAHARAAEIAAEHGAVISGSDILSSLLDRHFDSAPDLFDDAQTPGLECSRTGHRQASSTSANSWTYAYLLLGSTCTDTRRLAAWQEGLIQALGTGGAVRRITVGFHGIPGTPYLVKDAGDAHVFLLNDETEVSPEVIAAAANAALH